MSITLRPWTSERLPKDNKISWGWQGQVSEVYGQIIEAYLPCSYLGSTVSIDLGGSKRILAEVVGFRDKKSLLIALDDFTGVHVGAKVKQRGVYNTVSVSPSLLGRVVDPFLKSLGGEAPICDGVLIPIERNAPNPMLRTRISQPLGLGVRAIDGLLSCGEGQRLGIMAGSGVGKSVLLGMIARGAACDVNVIGLLGERGREVREFIERDLGAEGLSKSVVVVVTSDASPLLRLRGAKVVTALAEYFSSLGKKVLLMMDSLTRVAQSQREIGLSIGELPTNKGYTPSVFALLPRLLERCGPQIANHGSISGLYTVLVDGDDFNDPLPDAIRAILDGHIVLSRDLANRGHFPAININESISRVMPDISSDRQINLARCFRALLAEYNDNFDFVQMGAYKEGSNQMLDQALKLMPAMNNYLQQDSRQKSDYNEAFVALEKVLAL